MQAVIFEYFGGPDVLRVVELPKPVLQPHQVLVKVETVAVDPVDTFIRQGTFKTALTTPAIIGRDLVGTVAKLADSGQNFTVGQTVWTNSAGYDGRMGATAEYVAVADRLYPVPQLVDEAQLAASVHPAATELCRKMGSDLALDYYADLTTEMARRQQKFDHVIDTSGKLDLTTSLSVLKLNGQVTLITAPQSNQFRFDVRRFYTAQQRIVGFVISHATGDQLKRAASWLNQNYDQSCLLGDEVYVRPFSAAAAVHAAVESGQTNHHRYILQPDAIYQDFRRLAE